MYNSGLEAAVEDWLEQEIHKRHGIEVEFVDDGRPKPLDDDVRDLLYQSARELLINAVKHAKSKKIIVSARKKGYNIIVNVTDDGVGFKPDEAEIHARTGGFGLFNIRERIDQVNGRLDVVSKPGAGTSVTMTAPLKLKT